jgi:hypothetical protein
MSRRSLRPFARFVERYYFPIATALNLILIAGGASFVSAWEQPWRDLITVLALVLVIVIDLLLRKVNDREKARGTYEKCIDELLEVAAVSMLAAAGKQRDGSIRVNIMLLHKKTQTLRIYYEYGFLNTDQDRLINIPINAGCAGQAWMRRCATVADPTELFAINPAEWGLPRAEIDKIRPSLQSIFSVPILKTDNTINDTADNICIGVLNFDSEHTIEEMKFKDIQVQLVGFGFAQMLLLFLEAMA